MNPVGNITDISDKIKCLSVAAHEAWESSFAKIPNLEVTLIHQKGNKKWCPNYRKVPDNYIIAYNRQEQIKLYDIFNLVISHNKFDQFRILYPLAQQAHLKLISIEHTCRMPHWTKENMVQFNNMRGDINVFITEWSLKSWEWEDRGDTVVIPHAIDTDIFLPANQERKNKILVVANDLIGRGYILGFDIIQQISQGLQIKFIGDTKGLSKPASNVEELVREYQNSRILLNCTRLSPIPMNLLEAMACGCVPVSLNTCAISDYVKDGYNGMLANSVQELHDKLRLVYYDDDLAEELSKNAVKTIRKKCRIDRFIKQWQEVFDKIL